MLIGRAITDCSVKQSYTDGIIPQLFCLFCLSRRVVIERGKHQMWDHHSFLWVDLKLRKLLYPLGWDERHEAHAEGPQTHNTVQAQNSCHTLCWWLVHEIAYLYRIIEFWSGMFTVLLCVSNWLQLWRRVGLYVGMKYCSWGQCWIKLSTVNSVFCTPEPSVIITFTAQFSQLSLSVLQTRNATDDLRLLYNSGHERK